VKNGPANRALTRPGSPEPNEDYYLLGKRETIERADVEAIVASLKSPEFTAYVRGIPGYDTSRAGEIANVSDLAN